MNRSDKVELLVALVHLLQPTASKDEVLRGVSDALEFAGTAADTPRAQKPPRIDDSAIRSRVVDACRTLAFCPARRELYPLVTGNRNRVAKIIESMIQDGTFRVERVKRQIALYLADGTSRRDCPAHLVRVPYVPPVNP